MQTRQRPRVQACLPCLPATAGKPQADTIVPAVFSCSRVEYRQSTDRLRAHIGVALCVAAREYQAGYFGLVSAGCPSWIKDGPNPMGFSDTPAGICSSGMGAAWNNSRQGLASHRVHVAARLTRALSVEMPVLAYICR